MTNTLPHDEYITAVCDALTEAGLTPAYAFTDDSDTSGSHEKAIETTMSQASANGIEPSPALCQSVDKSACRNR